MHAKLDELRHQKWEALIEMPHQQSCFWRRSWSVTARPDATVVELAAEMVRHRVHRIFITDGPILVGVVSSMDVMKAVATAKAIRTRIRASPAKIEERIEIM